MADLEVQIISPAKSVAKTSARQVNAPGALGRLGILPGHAAMVVELGPGPLTLETASGLQSFTITGGYLDVAKDKVVVLADSVEKA